MAPKGKGVRGRISPAGLLDVLLRPGVHVHDLQDLVIEVLALPGRAQDRQRVGRPELVLAEVVEFHVDAGVFHDIVQEAGLLLLLVLPHQADGQYVLDGGCTDQVLQAVVCVRRNANGVFNAHLDSVFGLSLHGKDIPPF